MKHTKGKATVSCEPFTLLVVHELDTRKKVETICQLSQRYKTDEEIEANAELIAEAFNVTNECGLSPRQLLEQRNMLLEASKEAYRCLFDRIVQQYNQLGGCSEEQAELIALRDMKDLLLYNAINKANQ